MTERDDDRKVESEGPPTKDTIVRLSQQVLTRIAPALKDQHPNVIGAVLLNLTATWIANHRPDLRDGLLANWLNGLPAMIRACDKYRQSIVDNERRPDKLDS
jgi:hypothetical protein